MSGRAHLAVKLASEASSLLPMTVSLSRLTTADTLQARTEALADKLRTAYKDAKGNGRQVHVPWRQETYVLEAILRSRTLFAHHVPVRQSRDRRISKCSAVRGGTRRDLDAVRIQYAVAVRFRLEETPFASELLQTDFPFTPARYERSTEGYDPEEKRAELFHPEARFLLLRRAGESSESPLGYCIFRFDTEETEADEGEDDLCDVAYW